MATDTFTGLRTRLDTRLEDASNTTWTSAEKDELMKIAIDDPYVFQVARDTSLTTVGQQATYALPSTISVLSDLWIDSGGDGYPVPLDKGAWQVINGTIVIDKRLKYLPAGKTMWCVGKQKLATTDNIPDYLWEYVLELTMVECFQILATRLGSTFLSNDMTMAELSNKINAHRSRAQELRRNLQNKWNQVI